MQYTKIPGADMQASRICLGTMTFGSPVAGPDAVRLVRYALEEHGVNFIDTANMYEGYNRYAGSAGGVAEEIVGEAVAHRRGDYILATKVGMKVGRLRRTKIPAPRPSAFSCAEAWCVCAQTMWMFITCTGTTPIRSRMPSPAQWGKSCARAPYAPGASAITQRLSWPRCWRRRRTRAFRLRLCASLP